MPLLDHFHPPLSDQRDWESFHALWAAEIVRTLNRRVLPPAYFAGTQTHVGGRIEVDVPTFEQEGASSTDPNGSAGGVAVETWAPPTTTLVMPTVFPDEFEVQVYRSAAGAALVAAIELVSPGNKDRPETRRAFIAKCATYLHAGVGLIVVDVVTERLANLHNQLLEFMEQPEAFRFPADRPLYTAAFRPSRRTTGDQIELWLNPLALGERLPVMPLALRGGPTLPLDLESTYFETCQDSRL